MVMVIFGALIISLWLAIISMELADLTKAVRDVAAAIRGESPEKTKK